MSAAAEKAFLARTSNDNDKVTKKFLSAAKSNKWNDMLKYLRQGADVNALNSFGYCALRYALRDCSPARHGHQVFNALIAAGCNLNSNDVANFSPLAFALEWLGRAPDILLALLEGGADPNKQGDEGILALAAKASNYGAVRMFCEHGADIKSRATFQTYFRLNALDFACYRNDVITAEYLVREYGMNPQELPPIPTELGKYHGSMPDPHYITNNTVISSAYTPSLSTSIVNRKMRNDLTPVYEEYVAAHPGHGSSPSGAPVSSTVVSTSTTGNSSSNENSGGGGRGFEQQRTDLDVVVALMAKVGNRLRQEIDDFDEERQVMRARVEKLERENADLRERLRSCGVTMDEDDVIKDLDDVTCE